MMDKHDKFAKANFAWLREAGFRPEEFSFEVKVADSEKPDTEGLYIEKLAQMHRKYNPDPVVAKVVVEVVEEVVEEVIEPEEE